MADRTTLVVEKHQLGVGVNCYKLFDKRSRVYGTLIRISCHHHWHHCEAGQRAGMMGRPAHLQRHHDDGAAIVTAYVVVVVLPPLLLLQLLL